MQEEINNFVITLTGPSGCGKSYVIDRIMELEEKLAIHGMSFHPVRIPKFVTRSLRREEIQDQLEGKEIDVISCDYIPHTCDLKYQTYGNKYGLELKTIYTHLANGKSPVVVINDVRVVEELKKEFPERVLALFLFREVPRREFFENTAKSRGDVAESETDQRFNKATAIYRTYIENIGLFNRVILNPERKPNSEDYAQIQIENVIKGVLNHKITLKSKRNGFPKLFIIAGNSASGKDEIIQAVDDMGKLQAIIIPKYTSRMQDEDDGREMICHYIPNKAKMEKFKKEFEKELFSKKIESQKRELQAGENIDNKAAVLALNLKEERNIPTQNNRFWTALTCKKSSVCEELRNRIIQEASPEHRLEALKLFDRNFNELCEIYKMDGYHKKGVDVEKYLRSDNEISEQTIINRIVEESYVEHDICLEKLNCLNIQQLWKLYEQEGYHSDKVNVMKLKQKLEKEIMNEFFDYNPDYIDLEKISNDNWDYIKEQTKDQIEKVTGPAYYIEVNDKGIVMYENNKTLYGFIVSELNGNQKFLYQQMLEHHKHCVLVASLIDIFSICRPYFDDNIITVFSYSEISSEEFEEKSKAGTVDRKIEGFEKEIKKYSDYIADFDHVTIYAESELDQRNGGRAEELIDQIFRLFRYYSSN